MKPLIAIIGTTGVGKSRLAIELAIAVSKHTQKHPWQSAKVINSDAMQAYIGADVLTNKVPPAERCGIEHLLMDFKRPGEQYVVGQWVNDAVQTIASLHEQSILPIIVGGTAYWTQHLIFDNRLASLNSPTLFDDKSSPKSSSTYSPELAQRIDSLPGDLLGLFLDLPKSPQLEQASALHTLLATLDPIMAARWHWKDTRKVTRSLELLKERGCLTSRIMAEQALCQTKPRYRTLILWLYADPEALKPRLDARVDEMMKEGLLRDVVALRRTWNAQTFSNSIQGELPGIYQSIGFKEFNEYLSSGSPTAEQYKESVERIKISTRQYARRQVHWIRSKLLPAIQHTPEACDSEVEIYLLNATDLTKWQTEVHDTAFSLVQCFLENKSMPDALKTSELASVLLTIPSRDRDPTTFLNGRRMVICDICTVDRDSPTMMTEGLEWQVHQRSRRHRRNMHKYNQKNTSLPSLEHNSTTYPSISHQDSDFELALESMFPS